MKFEINTMYHKLYPFAQKMGVVGRWELAKHAHVLEIKKLEQSPLDILYCGTATEINPDHLAQTLNSIGRSASITTLDLSFEPLVRTDRNLCPVNANATVMPFPNESFDFITTDFLLNMVDLQTAFSIICEMSRTLKPSGRISTTTYTGNEQGLNTAYMSFTKLFTNKHYHSPLALNLIFKAAGMSLHHEKKLLSIKPLAYPTDTYAHLVATKNCDYQTQQESAALLNRALLISRITSSDPSLSPRSASEILEELLTGQMKVIFDNEQLVGFVSLRHLSGNVSELGSLYVSPNFRNCGVASKLFGMAVENASVKFVLAHTENQYVEKINTKHGFKRCSTANLPPEAVFATILDRIQNLNRIIYFAKSLISSKKTTWIKQIQ